MSCYPAAQEIMSICADYLVELRGFEPLTSAVLASCGLDGGAASGSARRHWRQASPSANAADLGVPLCDAPSRADGAQQKSFFRPVITNVINNTELVLTDRVRTLRAKVCFSSLQTISCQGAWAKMEPAEDVWSVHLDLVGPRKPFSNSESGNVVRHAGFWRELQ